MHRAHFWFRGHEAIAAFLAQAPFRVRWRHHRARANGQLAVGCFAWDDAAGGFGAYALDVLELRGDRIAPIVSFIDGGRFPAFGLPPTIFVGIGGIDHVASSVNSANIPSTSCCCNAAV
jgi:RNA polymerase sigma-70 factor (ECF subfamily)